MSPEYELLAKLSSVIRFHKGKSGEFNIKGVVNAIRSAAKQNNLNTAIFVTLKYRMPKHRGNFYVYNIYRKFIRDNKNIIAELVLTL